MAPTAPTLLEDWRERRELLIGLPRRDEHAELQLRVLEYLIHRYADAPEAASPARFPVPATVYVNERAVLVYHHVGQHLVRGAQSQQEAHEQVVSILRRMSAEHSEAVVPGDVSDALDEVNVAERGLDRVRLLLADPDPALRLLAMRILGNIGTLDDIGLLMDLLKLPRSADEAPGEREAISRAITRLSGDAEAAREPEPEPPPQIRPSWARPVTKSRGWRDLPSYLTFLALGFAALAVSATGLPGYVFTLFAIISLSGLVAMVATAIFRRIERHQRR